MKKVFIFTIAFLLLSGVKWQLSPRILPLPQMVAILVDVELAKALLQQGHYDHLTKRSLHSKNNQYIYQIHGTDPTTFQASYQHYLKHPKHMITIYKAVIKELKSYPSTT